MALSGFTRFEMSGHYIEVHGPGSEAEMLEALRTVIGPESIVCAVGCPPLVTLRGGRTIVFVDAAPGPDGPVVLAVGDLDHDDEARVRATEAIFRSLSAQTPWRLSCSTDGGDDVSGMRWAS
jgi:hypothetical protein